MASKLAPLPPSFARGLVLIDEAHSQDPNKIDGPDGPKTLPYELHYARKMTRWLEARSPTASPELQLACRAQHFKRYPIPALPTLRVPCGQLGRRTKYLPSHRRWELPRSAFPMTRPGYLTWRVKQKTQAAAQVAALLADASISPPLSEASRARVGALVRKESLATDEETQALEDAACLVFLDDQFDDFEAKADIDEDKMVGILRKTWAKMSGPGRALALAMDLSERAKLLIGRALEPQEAAAA
ncbi:glutamyl-tRNA synthetase [Purpureocillium lavendulum]|uniref:Glutamyl-tRNA synthetase n=1 Tax=Purpureocillium lavendulum TaxID=1247861 RepID=A0AB34FJ24_9HYPO|nr:glutamyl-tRNA synthetase [Purpureocillium lavendulum]